MPGNIPRLLNRFNYWRFPGIDPSETAIAPHLANLERRARSDAIRNRPSAVLHSARSPWEGLRYRQMSDPRWASNAETQTVMACLQKQDRARLGRSVHRSGTDDVSWLLHVIARDQRIWERHAFERAKPQQISEQFNLDERGVDEILRHYNRQKYRLRGLSSQFHGKSLNELVVLANRRRVTLSGHRLVVSWGDDHLAAGDPRHWFAHALRNLKRHVERHDPLPWAAECRVACLKFRDVLSEYPRPSRRTSSKPAATPPPGSRQMR